MKASFHTIWTQTGSFRWLTRYGAIRGTVFAALLSAAFSCLFALLVMTFLDRVSLMGIFISTAIPLTIVPLHWYPFARMSEQLQATESRLRKSEGRYRSILEKMSEAYVELDQDGRLTFFNDSLCRITGYSRAELERREIGDFVTRHDFRRLRSSAARTRRSGTPGGLFDFPIAAKDGAARYLDASFSLLLDEEGRWSGYHAVLFDVTERFHSEQEKKAMESRLLRAKRMESLGILAGGVAHDLNNILCGIVGYPDLLLLDCRDEGFRKESLLAIKNSGEKAASVVQDLLTLSRRGVITTDVVSLNEIITDYLKSPEHQHLGRSFPGVVVTSELAPDLLAIEGSSHNLMKTVMNLVLNAFEAIVPPGTVSLSTANRYLDRPLVGYDRVQPGEYVTLTVSDSGVGISPEDTERIFEPFYTKKIMGRSGTGLGMAVVWGTVKDHRGYITVDSETGKGSTVELFFPASRRELPARAPTPGSEHYPGHGESLLVVDDMLDQRILVSRMLERLGYRVHAVPSGEEAVAHVTAAPVDLIVLDMIMDPGIDGLDTYRKLRAVRPGVKAIITSGYSETDRVREALRLGAGPYVKKPYRLETLARVVHETLQGSPTN